MSVIILDDPLDNPSDLVLDLLNVTNLALKFLLEPRPIRYFLIVELDLMSGLLQLHLAKVPILNKMSTKVLNNIPYQLDCYVMPRQSSLHSIIN